MLARLSTPFIALLRRKRPTESRHLSRSAHECGALLGHRPGTPLPGYRLRRGRRKWDVGDRKPAVAVGGGNGQGAGLAGPPAVGTFGTFLCRDALACLACFIGH